MGKLVHFDARVTEKDFFVLYRGCSTGDRLGGREFIWFSPDWNIARVYANDHKGKPCIWTVSVRVRSCLTIDDDGDASGSGYILNMVDGDIFKLDGMRGYTSADHESRGDFLENLQNLGIGAVHYQRGLYGNEGLVILDHGSIEITSVEEIT